MRVLITDDEKEIREKIVRFLEGYEHIEAHVVENGLVAKQHLEKESFDIVVVDLHMPEMDGLSLVHWIKETNFSLPIIMMSGYGDIPDAVEAMKLGIQDYIVKPFDLEEFVTRIQEVAQGQENQIARYIEFPAGYEQAGLSILNYFSTVLRQKHPDIHAKVTIEQDEFKVRMIIAYSEGRKEIVEKTLCDYGSVVCGKIQPKDFLEDPAHIMQLEQKLEMTKMELKFTKQLYEHGEAKFQQLVSLLDTFIKNKNPLSIQVCQLTGDVTTGVSTQGTETKDMSQLNIREELTAHCQLLSEKLAVLRKDYIIENDVEAKFKLKKRIEEYEADLKHIEQKLEVLENKEDNTQKA